MPSPRRATGMISVTAVLAAVVDKAQPTPCITRSAMTAAMPPNLDAASLPPEIATILTIPRMQRGNDDRATLAAFYLADKLDRELAALPPQQKVYAGTNRFPPDGSFRPAEEPRTIYVLHRGDVREPGAVAAPGALSCLPGFDAPLAVVNADDEGFRRAALARWLSDTRNVLVWRSIVNRVRPSVESLLTTELQNDSEALVRQAIRANVRASVNHLRHGSDILEERIRTDRLTVVGAEYSLETGVVEFFDGVPAGD